MISQNTSTFPKQHFIIFFENNSAFSPATTQHFYFTTYRIFLLNIFSHNTSALCLTTPQHFLRQDLSIVSHHTSTFSPTTPQHFLSQHLSIVSHPTSTILPSHLNITSYLLGLTRLAWYIKHAWRKTKYSHMLNFIHKVYLNCAVKVTS